MLQQTAVQHWTGLPSFWPGIVERRVSESKERADIQRLQCRIPKVMLLVSQYRLIYKLKTTVTSKLTKLVRPSLSEAELPAPCRQILKDVSLLQSPSCVIKKQWPSCPAPNTRVTCVENYPCARLTTPQSAVILSPSHQQEVLRTRTVQPSSAGLLISVTTLLPAVQSALNQFRFPV